MGKTILAVAAGCGALAWAPCAAGAVGARAPACQPSALNRSAALAGGRVTVSPAPGSMVAPPKSEISFLGPPAGALADVEVSASSTGEHAGRLVPYSQGDGASFVPDAPFAPGERVTVRAQLRVGAETVGFGWHFTVETLAPRRASAGHRRSPEATYAVQRFHSAPQLRPPLVTVTRRSRSSAPGYLLMSPEQPPVQSGPMIFDDRGRLVWFDPVGAGNQAVDFRAQSYAGRPVLTFWERVATGGGGHVARDVILDDHYRTLAFVRAGNGLTTDTHEFQLTPRGTALLSAAESASCDLSRYGGPADGAVLDGVVQEIDVASGRVMFQWNALDHVSLADAYVSARPTAASRPFDFFHLNSIDLDRDGSLLVSSRNTWAVYDLDPRTGKVRWRFGGRHSSFAMGRGTAPAFQHSARQLAGGELSVFDNGGSPRVHPQSRALVARLEVARHRVTLVHSFEHTPPIAADSQGDVQSLPGGRYLVGWGQTPDVSEFDASGRVLFDAHLPAGEQSYRAFRSRWDGQPLSPPAVALSAPAHGRVTVWASWNGATGVRAWRVLETAADGATRAVATRERSGFETAVPVSARAGALLTVQALGARGRVLGTAAAAAVAASPPG